MRITSYLPPHEMRFSITSTSASFSVILRKDTTLQWTERVQCRCEYHLALGYPCLHASFALLYLGRTVKNQGIKNSILTKEWLYHLPVWYSDIYHLCNIVSQYSTSVVFPDKSNLRKHQLWPPLVKIPPGRPKKNRRRSSTETNKKVDFVRDIYDDS